MISDKQNGVKALVDAADHGIRAVRPVADETALLWKTGDIHVASTVMCIFDIDLVSSGINSSQRCGHGLALHLFCHGTMLQVSEVGGLPRCGSGQSFYVYADVNLHVDFSL